MQPPTESEEPAPIDPHALLEHARKRLDAPEPSESECRRAVSDAFYALYHALTLAAVPHMTASDDPLEPYRRVRAIRHRHVRNAARTEQGSADGQVRMVADAMLRLYLWREAADYDHLVRFASRHAHDAIDLAEEAVEAVSAPAFGGQSFPRRLATLPGAP